MTQEPGKGKAVEAMMVIYDMATEQAEKEETTHRDAFQAICGLVELLGVNRKMTKELAELERSIELNRKAVQLYHLSTELIQRSREAYRAGNMVEGDELYRRSLEVEAQAIGREVQAAKEKIVAEGR